MAFRVPTMPSFCDVYDNPGPFTMPSIPPRSSAVQCQLRYLKTVQGLANRQTYNCSVMLLLVLATEDIRMYNPTRAITGGDWIEVPAGSGRYYEVQSVDQIARDFANEHRAAILISRNDIIGAWVD